MSSAAASGGSAGAECTAPRVRAVGTGSARGQGGRRGGCLPRRGAARAAEASRRDGDSECGRGRGGRHRGRREVRHAHRLAGLFARADAGQPPCQRDGTSDQDRGDGAGHDPGGGEEHDGRDDEPGHEHQDRKPLAQPDAARDDQRAEPARKPAGQRSGLGGVTDPVDRGHAARRGRRRRDPDLIGVDPVEQRGPCGWRGGQPGERRRAPAERPERPGDPPVGAGDHPLRHPAGGQRRVHGARARHDPGVDRRGHRQGRRGEGRYQVADPQRRHRGPGQLGRAQQCVGRLDLGDLPPGRGHQGDPLASHDLGAHPGRGAVARIQVQVGRPAGPGAVHGRDRRVPLAVERRDDMRVAGGWVVRIVHRRRRGQVDQVLHRRLERVALRPAPRCRGGRGAAQRSLEPERPARAGDPGRRVIHCHRRGAHVRGKHGRRELAHQRLEVPGVAGAEGEPVVDRQPQGRGRLRGPGRIGGVQAAHVRAEAGLAADLESGDEERRVGGLGVEPPRAQHTGDGRGRIRRDRGAEVTVPADLGVRPVPRVTEGLQRRHRLNVDHRERVGHDIRRGELPVLQRDEGDEGPQPVGVGQRRGEQPREVGVVELDAREVVRFEVHRPVAGLGPDHMPGIDADHVARPVQVDGELRCGGVGDHRIPLHGGHVQRDVKGRTVGQARAVHRARVGTDAAPHPRAEVVLCAGRVGEVPDRHAACPSGTSCKGMTCSRPASAGLAARCAVSAALAA